MKRCEEWALEHGANFEPNKSELTHFTKKRRANITGIRLGNAAIQTRQNAIFFRIRFNRQLKWKEHIKSPQKKMKRQRHVLTAITASTWDLPIRQALEVYDQLYAQLSRTGRMGRIHP